MNQLTFFTYLSTWVDALRKREEGQTMAEYAVVLAVITLLVIVALAALSSGIVTKLGEVTGILTGAGSSG